MYNENELSNSHADLVYQTELENAIWDIKLYQGENDIPIIQYEKTERSGRISWFDIYQTNARSYVDFTLNGEVPSYKTEMVLFTLYESTKSKVMNEYKSEVIPVYDKEQIKNDLTTLKQELNVQNGYINELSQFTDVAVLQQMAGNYSASLQQYEGIQFIPKDENDGWQHRCGACILCVYRSCRNLPYHSFFPYGGSYGPVVCRRQKEHIRTNR